MPTRTAGCRRADPHAARRGARRLRRHDATENRPHHVRIGQISSREASALAGVPHGVFLEQLRAYQVPPVSGWTRQGSRCPW